MSEAQQVPSKKLQKENRFITPTAQGEQNIEIDAKATPINAYDTIAVDEEAGQGREENPQSIQNSTFEQHPTFTSQPFSNRSDSQPQNEIEKSKNEEFQLRVKQTNAPIVQLDQLDSPQIIVPNKKPQPESQLDLPQLPQPKLSKKLNTQPIAKNKSEQQQVEKPLIRIQIEGKKSEDSDQNTKKKANLGKMLQKMSDDSDVQNFSEEDEDSFENQVSNMSKTSKQVSHQELNDHFDMTTPLPPSSFSNTIGTSLMVQQSKQIKVTQIQENQSSISQQRKKGVSPSLSKYDSGGKYLGSVNSANTLDLKKVKSVMAPQNIKVRLNQQAQEKEDERRQLREQLNCHQRQDSDEEESLHRGEDSEQSFSSDTSSIETFSDDDDSCESSSEDNSDYSGSEFDRQSNNNSGLNDSQQLHKYSTAKQMTLGFGWSSKKQLQRQKSIDKKKLAEKRRNSIDQKFDQTGSKKRQSTLRTKSLFRSSSQRLDLLDDRMRLNKQPAKKFSKGENFEKMTKRIKVTTSDVEDFERQIESITISNDEKHVIAVLKHSIKEILFIRIYKLGKVRHLRQITLENKTSTFIKGVKICQDQQGKLFCLPFYDSGVFKARVFDIYNDRAILDNINDLIGISKSQKINSDSIGATINAVITEKDTIFVNLFDIHGQRNCHFEYQIPGDGSDIKQDAAKMIDENKLSIKSKPQNYPVSLLHDNEFDIYYVIYRHGQCITINCMNEQMKYQFGESHIQNDQNDQITSSIKKLKRGSSQAISEMSGMSKLGNTIAKKSGQKMKEMINRDESVEQFTKMGVGITDLYNNKILICKQACNILFFKRDSINHEEILDEKDQHLYHWNLYHTLALEGTFFQNNNQDAIIVTTLEKIYLYNLDNEGHVPELQSVMDNNIKCRNLISSPNNIAYIKYNLGDNKFEIILRKYMHLFSAQIDAFDKIEDDNPFCALNLERSKTFCVSSTETIKFYHQESFKPMTNIFSYDRGYEGRQDCLELQLSVIEKNNLFTVFNQVMEQSRILNMKVSGKVDSHVHENFLAIMIGTSPIKQPRKAQKLIIYEILYKTAMDISMIKLYKEQEIPPELSDISTEFEFQNKDCKTQTNIFLIDKLHLYLYNFGDITDDGAEIWMILSLQLEFGFTLKYSPDIFVMNETQEVAFIASNQDAFMVHLAVGKTNSHSSQKFNKDKRICNIDDIFKLSEIKKCIYSKGNFFIVANQRDKHKGIFLLEIEENPFSKSSKEILVNTTKLKDKELLQKREAKFIINDVNLYDIGDVDMYCMEGQERDMNKFLNTNKHISQKIALANMNITDIDIKKKLREQIAGALDLGIDKEKKDESTSIELVLSYKTIYKNTYNYLVIDISNQDSRRFVFNHETFHVWEQYIKGILLETNDFLTISKNALTVTSIQRQTHKVKNRKIKDKEKLTNVKLHSLQECAFLQLSIDNHISFRYSKSNKKVEIIIEDQFRQALDQSTNYYEIFKIQVEEMSFWELLFLQSLYTTSSEENMAKVIREQPNTNVFFKPFLELELSNLLTLLSFDNKSIKALLSPEQLHKFDKTYPIFYKQKPKQVQNDDEDMKIETAIDIALENYQIQAVELMISYIVQYQNKYAHSYLFSENFTDLISNNIKVHELLSSDLFYRKLDFNDKEWPNLHQNDQTIIMPYNSPNIFGIRTAYHEIFSELVEEEKQQQEQIKGEDEDQKQHKINYYLNLLPQMGKDYHDMMDIISESNFTNLEIFTTPAMITLIKYKKQQYADRWTNICASFHFTYVLCFLVHLNITLPQDNQDQVQRELGIIPNFLIGIMFFCCTFAFAFDSYQFRKVGWQQYFIDAQNYLDMLYIIFGYTNLFMNLYYPHHDYINILEEHDENEQHYHDINIQQMSKLISILFVIIMLIKSLFFIRMIDSFIKLVIMVIGVISDLKQFVVFYFFIMVMLSLILGILGVGNNEWIPNEAQREKILELQNDSSNVLSFPMDEYGNMVNYKGFRNLYIIMRYSLGDFSFYPIMFLEKKERRIFWLTWMIIVFITCIVFLNFIIAEVSQSYQKVVQSVDEQIMKQKAQMIGESEDMLSASQRVNQENFPMYIVVREKDHT